MYSLYYTKKYAMLEKKTILIPTLVHKLRRTQQPTTVSCQFDELEENTCPILTLNISKLTRTFSGDSHTQRTNKVHFQILPTPVQRLQSRVAKKKTFVMHRLCTTQEKKQEYFVSISCQEKSTNLFYVVVVCRYMDEQMVIKSSFLTLLFHS